MILYACATYCTGVVHEALAHYALVSMRQAKRLFDDVRAAQELLGTGEVEAAVRRAEVLREEARRLLAKPTLTSFERTYARGAVVYATVTLVLGAAESGTPSESVPQIRSLAVGAVRDHRPGSETWKVLGAAAEMLARSGDATGAVWAAQKARELGPDEDYLVQVAGGIRSMYPQAYAEAEDPPGAEPPPLPERR